MWREIDELAYGFRTGVPEEGGPKPPKKLTEVERSGGDKPPGSTGPLDGFKQPEAADEPPTNRAEEDSAKLPTEGRPTNEPPIDWAEEDAAKPETKGRTAEALNKGTTAASTNGYP